jgi:hypothetical protein
MSFIDSIPLWLLAIIVIGGLSIVIEIGYQFGKRIAAERGLSKHPVEASVAAAILSLMAFMLGFSFANASSRHGQRKDLMLEDANTASTLYLRADFLPPEKIEPARKLIREYIQIRTEAIRAHNMEGMTVTMKRSREIQDDLWDLSVEARGESNNVSLNLFIGTLNDLIDTDAKRLTAAVLKRFPPTLWFTLAFLGGMSTVMLGFNSGLHGRRSRLATTSLIVAFSVVIILIVDLDRPIRSLFTQHDVPGERALQNMQP